MPGTRDRAPSAYLVSIILRLIAAWSTLRRGESGRMAMARALEERSDWRGAGGVAGTHDRTQRREFLRWCQDWQNERKPQAHRHRAAG